MLSYSASLSENKKRDKGISKSIRTCPREALTWYPHLVENSIATVIHYVCVRLCIQECILKYKPTNIINEYYSKRIRVYFDYE